LNYASDIDLIFSVFGRGHDGRGRVARPNQQPGIFRQARLSGCCDWWGRRRVKAHPTESMRASGLTVVKARLACSLDEAINYYQRRAEDWELQALIRARSAAGSIEVFSRFEKTIDKDVYRSSVSVVQALANVRNAKEKIDLQHERAEKGL
jgi:glutamine synthetase adenylyltransferase